MQDKGPAAMNMIFCNVSQCFDMLLNARKVCRNVSETFLKACLGFLNFPPKQLGNCRYRRRETTREQYVNWGD